MTFIDRLDPISGLRSLALASFLFVAACGSDPNTTTECTAGEKDCECREGNLCDGELVCQNDLCVDASCTPGATGCACLSDDTCTSTSDACENDVCGPRTSCEGELGCACEDGACDAGLTCSNDLCTASNAVLLTVSGGDARACDVLVQTTGRKVAEVTFPAGVRGKMRTRDLKTAVALIRTSDTALGGVVAAITFEGDEPVADSEAGVATTQCYDRAGAPAAGVTVTAN